MAELTEPQKSEIVEGLACFREPASIIAHFRLEHGLELSHKQVGRYDPTRPYYDAGEKWREIFEARREAYLDSVASVPVAHQGYRLNMLQKGVEAAEKASDWPLVAQLLEQAAKEVGGTLTNRRKLEVSETGWQRAVDMTPDERRAALAELIRQAIEAAPARLAMFQEPEGAAVQ